MNKTESVRNWLVILVILIATGIVTAVLPLLDLTPNISIGFGPTRPPVEGSALVIPVPPFLSGVLGTQIVLSPLEAFALFVGLTVVALVSVVVVGLIFSFLVRMLSKSVTAVTNSESYQTNAAALEKKEQEKIKTIRESHPKPSAPVEHVYILDPLSLSLMVLFFLGIIATLTYSVLVPHGEFTLFGQTFYSGLPILIILFVITIPLLAWRVRRNRLEAVIQKDNAPIPWDFIAVLIAGLLVVGIGLGLLLFINAPA
ncbi:MAG: hypothetical protein KC441_19265 [Anaerolineales bacterium]|nr:hypothetical protein [Anaerolineales bacterium]MCB8988784.1 hypothetical protein [Ardenticatenaceae bacterium]